MPKIDGNETMKKAMKAFHSGDHARGYELQDDFLEEVKEVEDHCSCPKNCKYHGRCRECVLIHRAHRKHLPCCFRDMVNKRVRVLSELTEHSALNQK